MDLGPHKRPIPPPQSTPRVPVYSCWGKLEEFICCQRVLNLRLVFISASKTAPSAFRLCRCGVFPSSEEPWKAARIAIWQQVTDTRPVLFPKHPFIMTSISVQWHCAVKFRFRILCVCTPLMQSFFIRRLSAQSWDRRQSGSNTTPRLSAQILFQTLNGGKRLSPGGSALMPNLVLLPLSQKYAAKMCLRVTPSRIET